MTAIVPARALFVGLAAATILLGLGLQRSRDLLDPTLSDVLGDALWAAMIYWTASGLAPSLDRRRRLILALAACYGVEFSQLYHAPGLDSFRRTTFGHLVLGSDFDLRDLASYTIGVLAAFILEPLLFRWIHSKRKAGK